MIERMIRELLHLRPLLPEDIPVDAEYEVLCEKVTENAAGLC